jgi:16S rRNA (cytosine967-C5)-methyltransferase
VQENIERFNIKNITLFQGKAQTQDWWDGQHFDKILLDAPCSATGVIRRHPDIKLLRKPKDISALITLQKDILNNLWTMLV